MVISGQIPGLKLPGLTDENRGVGVFWENFDSCQSCGYQIRLVVVLREPRWGSLA